MHVERAQFVNAKLSTKNEKAVEFSETLDLTLYTMWDQQSGTQRRTATYKLQGVVMHHDSKSTKTGEIANKITTSRRLDHESQT